MGTLSTTDAYPAMKLVKTRLRNKMKKEFLSDCLTI